MQPRTAAQPKQATPVAAADANNAASMKAFLEEKYAKMNKTTSRRQQRLKKFEEELEGSMDKLSVEEAERKRAVFQLEEAEREREQRKM